MKLCKTMSKVSVLAQNKVTGANCLLTCLSEQLVPIEILRRGFETGQTVTQVVSGFLNCPESSTNRTLFELCTESCKCLPGLTCSTQREQLTETFKAQLVTQPKFEQFRVGKCLI
uniref:Uncharacterized protein n=1 Tax=Mucochytrium quahogii TaxID=96639 RepID=A0A7S2WT12_9STRA|mmetsp:Transcript_9787/g.21291  ORF Transcript_9787/g.21291 Transcript_9787/m.21291 type:complete len:115 (+) Transcript_9787:402-746(+)